MTAVLTLTEMLIHTSYPHLVHILRNPTWAGPPRGGRLDGQHQRRGQEPGEAHREEDEGAAKAAHGPWEEWEVWEVWEM